MSDSPTILVVDDQDAGRFTLESLLATQGYRVLPASNGPEALAIASADPPDIILLDIMMPGMDGFEVCRRLRANPITAEIPVIFVTALDDQESMLKGLDVGADDFISKPFSKVRLRAQLQTITRLNRYRRLQQERAKFEWAVRQSDHGYLIVSPEGTIQYSNLRANQYLNLPDTSPAEISDTFLELARRLYQPQPPEAWENWPASALPDTKRFLVRPETGTSSALWLQVDMLDSGPGYALGNLIRLKNVTAEMAAARNLRSFHSTIQHKLRTPMVGVIGGLEVLASDAADAPPEFVFEMADMALESARRLQTSIEGILEHLKTSTEPLRYGAGCPLQNLKPLADRVAKELNLPQLTVTDNASEMAGQLPIAAPNVETIWRELLTNSLKFHPQHNPAVEISIDPAGNNHITLRVADDGSHIAPENLHLVWTPYFQDEKNFTGQVSGMGLGLATVAGLVWSVNGSCAIRNQHTPPGVVVEITLPCHPAEHGAG